MTTWLTITLLLAAAGQWPGDRNGDGRITVADYNGVTLLEYADHQVRHGRHASGDVRLVMDTHGLSTVDIAWPGGGRAILLTFESPVRVTVTAGQGADVAAPDGLRINLLQRSPLAAEPEQETDE